VIWAVYLLFLAGAFAGVRPFLTAWQHQKPRPGAHENLP
jgi:hypothetical protein